MKRLHYSLYSSIIKTYLFGLILIIHRINEACKRFLFKASIEDSLKCYISTSGLVQAHCLNCISWQICSSWGNLHDEFAFFFLNGVLPFLCQDFSKKLVCLTHNAFSIQLLLSYLILYNLHWQNMEKFVHTVHALNSLGQQLCVVNPTFLFLMQQSHIQKPLSQKSAGDLIYL